MIDIKNYIRDIPDFPKPGIIFKDITPLLSDKEAFASVIEQFAQRYRGKAVDKIVAAEARGFIFGGALAKELNAGLIPVRKKDKLPYKTINVAYELEYGTDTLYMHKDAVKKGENILILDDLLATGGTAKALCELVETLKGKVIEIAFVIELLFLNGRYKLNNYSTFSLIQY